MKPLKLGVLGVSGHLLTRMMLPFMKEDAIEVLALASRNLEKAKIACETWGVPKAYDSYEGLLADKHIEAVYIPLPNHMHLEWVKKSLDAGKHVLCEKPLTLTSEETRELIAYAEGKGLVVMEAFMYRFHPKWQEIQELMKVKGIGDVRSIHTIFTYSNSDPKNIRNIKEFGGGALMDIGCYAISSARWIMGKEPLRVMGLNTFSEEFGTDVLSSGILDFGTARALFTVSTNSYPQQEVKVYGTSGALTVKVPFNDLYDVPAELIVENGLGTRTITFKPTNQYGEMAKAFAKAVRKDQALPVPLEDSYMNMKIIESLLNASDQETWVEV